MTTTPTTTTTTTSTNKTNAKTHQQTNKPTHQQTNQPTNKRRPTQTSNTTSWQAYASASCFTFKAHSQKDRPSSLAPELFPLSTSTNADGPRQALSIMDVAAKQFSTKALRPRECFYEGAAKKEVYASFHGSLGFYLKANREICPQNCLQLSWARAKLTGPANAAFCAQLLAKQITNVSRGCPKISLTYLSLPTSTPAPNANKPQSKSNNTKPTTNKPNKQIKT